MRITITSLAIVLLSESFASGVHPPCAKGNNSGACICEKSFPLDPNPGPCKCDNCAARCFPIGNGVSLVQAAPGLPLNAPPVKKSPTIAPTPRTAPGAANNPPDPTFARGATPIANDGVSGFTPPGYAPAPPGFVYQANRIGSDGKVYPWGLVELPKVNSPVANVPPVKTQQYRMEYRCTGTKCEWVQVPVN